MKEYKCECERIFFSSQSFNGHKGSCKIHLERKGKSKEIKRVICEKCGAEIANTQIKKHFNFCDGSGTKLMKQSLSPKNGRNWSKGKIQIEIYGEEKFKEKIKKQNISLKLTLDNGAIIGKCKDPEREIQRRKNLSVKMKGNSNWKNSINVSGRGKKGKFKDEYFASSWELAFMIFHSDYGIKFQRNWEKFDYIDDQGRKRKYIPDFIVNEEFIEVKGFVTKNVLLKQLYFPRILHILDKNGMKEILDYVIEKYGKDFVNNLKD